MCVCVCGGGGGGGCISIQNHSLFSKHIRDVSGPVHGGYG